MIRRQRDDAQAFDEAWEARSRSSAGVSAEVAQLVACAEQLCRSAVAEPSPEFRASLRTQLMTEATTVLAPAAQRPRMMHIPAVHQPSFAIRRRLAGATAALVGAAGFVGMVGASAQAIPGEMLYPVKRGVENVELAFHKDDLTRGEFRLTQASERLAEARQLTDGSSPQSQDHVAGVLDDFADQANDGSSALFRSYGQNGSERSITVVNDFSAAAAADLAILSGRVPRDADGAFQAAANTVSQLVSKASTLCSSCGAADVTGLAGAVTNLDDAQSSTDPTPTPSSANRDAGATSSNTSEAEANQAPGLDVPSLPIIPSPTQSGSTPTAPEVKDLTDPTLDALLGNEEEPGLVGGLVDGLLGGGNQN